MGIYLSTPKTEKFSEDGENDRLRYGVSSMQGWRATMEDAHAAYPNLDSSTSFFGVYDGHGGKVVAKFCAKHLHQQLLKSEAYQNGELGTSIKRAFLRMDEMMSGQRGRRELALLGDKVEKFTGMVEGLIWSPKNEEDADNWAVEEGSDYHGPDAGSTACVAVIRNNQLIVANAGDSRCVLCRGGEVELSDDDEFLVIACDGIWDCMSSQELVDYVSDQLKTETKLSAICERVFDRGIAPSAGGEGCDNMTMILVQFKRPNYSCSSTQSQPIPSEPSGTEHQTAEELKVSE
ncbi:PPM-type phosphatase-like domain [Dillenia turbinata]|uniref:protein-serine/threonine phosphatase n=1 Tax=Dillenia turbinata TaxID=194707 RepID=A0AAN8UGG2_9MAGN